MKIAVLGAGMVGRTIAYDLSKAHEVTSIDINETNLQHVQQLCNAKVLRADLQSPDTYYARLAEFDMCVTAVPGFMGYQVLETVIKAGKNVVDISFFPEDPFSLHALAVATNVTAIVDCGVAPGVPNLVLGYHNQLLDIQQFDYMVGGLPKIRLRPFEYKAPFSPIDVIEEYTRPARMIVNGKPESKPALSDLELIEIEGVGTLEAFNTDGLRTLLTTMPHITEMKEKTLRYPGHASQISALQQAGFFSNTPILINGTEVNPLAFTSNILIDQWKLLPGEEEITVMQINIFGKRENKKLHIQYSLHDEYDVATQTTSMSRTTGYTCTAAVQLLINNLFTERGVLPPEMLGRDERCFNFMMNYLSERNVVYKMKTWEVE